MPTAVTLSVPTSWPEIRAIAETLPSRLDDFLNAVPSLDELITTHRDNLIISLIILAALGVAFITLVSYIQPSDFHGETADGPDAPPHLVAADHDADGKYHLLVAATGSVAAIKLPHILQALTAAHPPSTLSIRVILTPDASRFLTHDAAEHPFAAHLDEIPGVDGVYTDADEWDPMWTRGAPILHIELRRWAHALLVAPLSADSLAKFALGLSDTLVASVVRAWDPEGRVAGDGRRRRVLVAPAMNTAMWEHPATGGYVSELERWRWVEVLRPVEKVLACGDVGAGAMMEWKDIVKRVEERCGLGKGTAPTKRVSIVG